jgi:hypothetical protein
MFEGVELLRTLIENILAGNATASCDEASGPDEFALSRPIEVRCTASAPLR